MANKTIRIKHKDIQDTQTITDVTTKAFEKQGLDIHMNDVVDLHDDFGSGDRVLTVESKKHLGQGSEKFKQNYAKVSGHD